MKAASEDEVGLQPHRLKHYLASPDPDFEAKAKDILGLYLHPPEKAAVFCIDEKTAIQALDRTQPALPCDRDTLHDTPSSMCATERSRCSRPWRCIAGRSSVVVRPATPAKLSFSFWMKQWPRIDAKRSM
jgi:hypothetical protein